MKTAAADMTAADCLANAAEWDAKLGNCSDAEHSYTVMNARDDWKRLAKLSPHDRALEIGAWAGVKDRAFRAAVIASSNQEQAA